MGVASTVDRFVSLLLLVTVSRSLSIARAFAFSLVVSFSHCDLFCFSSVISTFFISVFLHVVFALIDRNLTKSSRLSVKIFSFQCFFSGFRHPFAAQ